MKNWLCNQFEKQGLIFRVPLVNRLAYRIHKRVCPEMRDVMKTLGNK
jgi:hypothetical protein